MYNYPKLGSFLDLKTKKNSIKVSKKYAREVYPDSANVIELDGTIYFVVNVTWQEPDSLMVEPMRVCGIVFQIQRDTSSDGIIGKAHCFNNELITHPDYNGRVKVLKGSLDNFIKELT